MTLFKTNLRSLFVILAGFSLLLSSTVHAQEDISPTEEDHQQLIALRENATKALHERDYETLATKVVAKEFSLTTATQKHFTSIDSFKTYYEGLFVGPSAVLKSIELRPVADSKTRFISQDIGVVQGSSEDTYTFSDSDVRTMPTRWSATVIKEDGQWRVASLHIGADFSDNPVIDTVKGIATWTAVAAFIIGALVGWLFGRRRKS